MNLEAEIGLFSLASYPFARLSNKKSDQMMAPLKKSDHIYSNNNTAFHCVLLSRVRIEKEIEKQWHEMVRDFFEN